MVATPNLRDGTAGVKISAWVSNPGPVAARVEVAAEIHNQRTGSTAASWRQSGGLRTSTEIPLRSTSQIELDVVLPRSAVELWDQDHPNLYRVETKVSGVPPSQPGSDSHDVIFGIRSIEARGTRLLLNGKPIKMKRINRYSDDPEFGMIEPLKLLDQDLSLMKRGNMELEQPPHYPMPPAMFDWADRNGLLMIEETGNVWLTPEQMDSPQMASVLGTDRRNDTLRMAATLRLLAGAWATNTIPLLRRDCAGRRTWLYSSAVWILIASSPSAATMPPTAM